MTAIDPRAVAAHLAASAFGSNATASGGLSWGDGLAGSSPADAPGASALAPFMLLPGWEWQWRLRLCIALLWLGTVWTYRVALPQPPGWTRLLASLPALALQFALPFLFHPFNEPITAASVTFLSVRMPATKILALAFGRGPLAAPSLAGRLDQSLTTFLVVCPVVPRWTPRRGGQDQGPNDGEPPPSNAPAARHAAPAPHPHPRQPATELQRTLSDAYSAAGNPAANRANLMAEMACKWAAFGATTAAAACWGPALPLLLHAALGYGMVALMGGLMDAAALYCTWRWRVDLVPPFRSPFLATSLADFWSRRWNVTQSRVLRGLLYDPIMEGRLVRREHSTQHGAQHGAQQHGAQHGQHARQQQEQQHKGGAGAQGACGVGGGGLQQATSSTTAGMASAFAAVAWGSENGLSGPRGGSGGCGVGRGDGLTGGATEEGWEEQQQGGASEGQEGSVQEGYEAELEEEEGGEDERGDGEQVDEEDLGEAAGERLHVGGGGGLGPCSPPTDATGGTSGRSQSDYHLARAGLGTEYGTEYGSMTNQDDTGGGGTGGTGSGLARGSGGQEGGGGASRSGAGSLGGSFLRAAARSSQLHAGRTTGGGSGTAGSAGAYDTRTPSKASKGYYSATGGSGSPGSGSPGLLQQQRYSHAAPGFPPTPSSRYVRRRVRRACGPSGVPTPPAAAGAGAANGGIGDLGGADGGPGSPAPLSRAATPHEARITLAGGRGRGAAAVLRFARAAHRVLRACGRAALQLLWRGVGRPVGRWLGRYDVRRSLASLSVFVFSGVEHEVFHWYLERRISWHWLLFFSFHGLLVLAEAAAAPYLPAVLLAAQPLWLRAVAAARCGARGARRWLSGGGVGGGVARRALLWWAQCGRGSRGQNARRPLTGGCDAHHTALGAQHGAGDARPGAGVGAGQVHGRSGHNGRSGKEEQHGPGTELHLQPSDYWLSKREGEPRPPPRLPVWVRRLLTVGVLELTACWWFFGVVQRLHVVTHTAEVLRSGDWNMVR